MNEFEFFARIVEAARIFSDQFGELVARDSAAVSSDTTGLAAEAANAAFGCDVAYRHATAWDDTVAHVVMVVAERATQNGAWIGGLSEELREAYEIVQAVVAV